ncbi:MAG: PLP-dependent aminotransferase family protein [Acidaminococcus provencensis]|uniref:MocR-like pyridoxine biosynthesis transcription factor PdxR n=1 Tax=Acidaminococcus TaxID=904 RepID=UPI000CF97188|nr:MULTISPECIES: PLP-dependent aminotransferase family protein [Acidaminococcus]MCH4096597.1 PLP-dependent aminotransferase family protein [Acidaminococcus provencensis]RHK02562.1 PLP-dependent aminotransferase family protein [Acidaminococcus sp. AM05-11]
MATTFNFRPERGQGPLYRQLASYFRQEIREGRLLPLEFLPSIRKLNRDLKLSRTTAEAAYEILIDEGYVQNLPSRGYQVVDTGRIPAPKKVRPQWARAEKEKKAPPVLYNFSNNYIDTSTFDTVLWRRCLNKVLHSPGALAGYGDPQGEPVLREVLARYSYSARGVVCTPEQILVGAGLQALLVILLSILPVEPKRVGLEAPGFPQAEQVFHLLGWETQTFDPGDPKADWPGLLMISPANPYKGRALTERERNNLIVATQLERVYLLEDDYNGEFRYLHQPTPALHSFGNREQIIYVGSFSRTLLPSLRISYLVLPEKLLPAYRAVAARYNQTASTMEQLALAQYIEDGHLTRHVKKLRTRYREKSRQLRQALQEVFGELVLPMSYGSGLHLHIALRLPGTAAELAQQALKQGVRIIPVQGTPEGQPPEFLLSFAGIGEDKIRDGVKALYRALVPEK